MSIEISRRQILAAAGSVASAGLAGALHSRNAIADEGRSASEPFGYCFNTSTIREQKLDLPSIVDLVGRSGYNGIEPWIREIEQYAANGGSLKDLAKRIRDQGLVVASAIGFAQWIVDDDAKRTAGLEQAKRDMDLVRQIGGKFIAAPPAGANEAIDLNKAAERYRALLEVGDSIGVVPQLEVWGFSKALSKLSETVFVAVESGHKDACLLLDVYHLYKGGSEFAALKFLNGGAMHAMHINDYPGTPRAGIKDADRVYPGDGVAPLGDVLRTLRGIGFRGMLSLELFNAEYWKQDPAKVVATGLAKTKAAVQKALS
jgi:sugar phosphate isomerase/epimerase